MKKTVAVFLISFFMSVVIPLASPASATNEETAPDETQNETQITASDMETIIDNEAEIRLLMAELDRKEIKVESLELALKMYGDVLHFTETLLEDERGRSQMWENLYRDEAANSAAYWEETRGLRSRLRPYEASPVFYHLSRLGVWVEPGAFGAAAMMLLLIGVLIAGRRKAAVVRAGYSSLQKVHQELKTVYNIGIAVNQELAAKNEALRNRYLIAEYGAVPEIIVGERGDVAAVLPAENPSKFRCLAPERREVGRQNVFDHLRICADCRRTSEKAVRDLMQKEIS